MSTKVLRWTLLLAVFAFAASASAQAPAPAGAVHTPILYPQSFPGQFWTDNGNISPVEHSDIISASYFEQGVSLYRTEHYTFTPYVAFGVTSDTVGYDWNNRVQLLAGARFTRFFKHGIVSIGGAYSYEDRWVGSERKGGMTGQVDYWFGWQPVAAQTSRFPGSTWGAAGYLSPVEAGNFIYAQNFKQGVIAKRLGKNNAIVPFAELTSNVDTKGFDWENRVMPGAGVELEHFQGNTLTEVGAEYLYEHRFESGLSAAEASIFVKFWFGWNPIRGAKR